MKLPRAYKINQNNVSFENFGDEVVAINFETGSYFSFDSTAIEIWDLIKSGKTTAGILDFLDEKYSGERSDKQKSLEKFLSDLQQSQLIMEADSGETGDNEEPAAAPTENQKAPKPNFEPPVLQEYSDMQELLLLDPIHEVDQAGWPNQPPDSDTKTEK